MTTMTVSDIGMELPEWECSECDMRFAICWSRNPVFGNPEHCPFCGEEIDEIVTDNAEED